MKHYIKYIFSFIIFLTLLENKGKINSVTIPVGKSVVPNECSSLGINNPLRLLDCSIFKLDKGLCCLLTITNSNVTDIDIEDDVLQHEEIFRTACIILPKKDSKIINETSMRYKNLGEVLIECSQDYINNTKNMIFVSLLFFILGFAF